MRPPFLYATVCSGVECCSLAREEAADVVAVLYRALSVLESQIKNGKNTP